MAATPVKRKTDIGAVVYGGESPSPRRAKPAGSPLPPLGLPASRLALCARCAPLSVNPL